MLNYQRVDINISHLIPLAPSDPIGWLNPLQDHVDRVIFEKDPGVSLAAPRSTTDELFFRGIHNSSSQVLKAVVVLGAWVVFIDVDLGI